MKRTKEEEREELTVQQAAHNSSSGSNGNEAATSSTTSSASAAAAAAVRTTGRVKKPKQVYDPSDNYVSRASNRSSVGGGAGAGAAVSAATAVVSATAIASTAPSPPSSHLGCKDSFDTATDSNASPALPDHHQQQPPQQQSSQSRHLDTCQRCGKSEPKRGSGHKSNFLTCKSCMLKWHFPCLLVSFDNQSLARKKYKCEKCRYCLVCNIRGRNLPICSLCVEPYHPDCHEPPLKHQKLNEANPKWKCSRCKAANTPSNRSPQNEEPLLVPRKSNAGRKKRAQSDPAVQEKSPKPEKLAKLEPKKEVVEELPELEEQVEEREQKKLEPKKLEPEKQELMEEEPIEEIKEQEPLLLEQVKQEKPDQEEESLQLRLTPVDPPTDVENQPVSTWSVEQVVGFVAKHYPKEANVFRYQDIDGASLLLLTRQDVMNGFGLKLGPALRVFELVMALQNRTDDVTLAWFE
ncbi:hypothetical protein KR009_002207 [Drosophila setifemur]|nr:hypothetical protein KR009_002207 [Drosophila setifemur]